MVLKTLILTLAVVLSVKTVQANDDFEKMYLTIESVEVRKISHDLFNQEQRTLEYQKHYHLQAMPDQSGVLNSVGNVGAVIAVARDLVALGEDVYRLVIKGKPTLKTDYAPISVIPKFAGEPVDILDTEDWQVPRRNTYEVVYKNLFGMEVVKFRYSVIFAWGGTFEGKGSYLTAAQIVPEMVNVLFGYDFTATMKLGGILNHGSKMRPIAGATLLMEHTVSTVLKSSREVRTYHITGLGVLKEL